MNAPGRLDRLHGDEDDLSPEESAEIERRTTALLVEWWYSADRFRAFYDDQDMSRYWLLIHGIITGRYRDSQTAHLSEIMRRDFDDHYREDAQEKVMAEMWQDNLNKDHDA